MKEKSKDEQKEKMESQKPQVYVTIKQVLGWGVLYHIVKLLKTILVFLWGWIIFPLKKVEEQPINEVNLEREQIYLNEKDQKTWIYCEWQKIWLTEKNEKSEAAFFHLFTYDYVYTCNQYNHNKRKNFQMKFLCMLPFIIATVVFLLAVLGYNGFMFIQAKDLKDFFENTNWSFSIFSTFLYGVVFIIWSISVKWLDVRKYQETWNRHSAHKYEIEMEMFRYISNMDEYAETDGRQKFIKKIMTTWNRNQKKFNENMKKEKPMKDMLKNIKSE